MMKRNQGIKRKKKPKKWSNQLGTLITLLGICFILYGFKDSIESWFLRQGVDSEVSETLGDVLNTSSTKDNVTETVWLLPKDGHEPIINRQENDNENQSVGALIMPTLNKTVAIMDGVGGNNLSRGAGEQFTDQEMGVGNYVLSSHRIYDGSLFGDLERVNVNDTVYITDYETVWKYEVTGSDNQVETTQTHLLKDTKESILTMYGCTADGTMRVVKQAKLVGYVPIEDLGSDDKTLIQNN